LKPSVRDFDAKIKTESIRANVTAMIHFKFHDAQQYKNKESYNLILSSL
jgi:hypothetical protein